MSQELFDINIPHEIMKELVYDNNFDFDLLYHSVNPNEIQPNFHAAFPQKNEPKIDDLGLTDDSNDNSSMFALSPQQCEQEELEKLIVNLSVKLETKEETITRRSCRNVGRHSTVPERTGKTKKRSYSSKDKKMKNCKHVWQFLRDELKSESTNVEWIDKERGVFKIVNQAKVAELWGDYKERKSEKPMDYEKMSRGIRHSRKDGFFQFIDKEQSYGVKLVYQFGSKAIANCIWLNKFVNLD